ncbi:MAG: metal-dependent hydrolase [Suipraeoptans sp.]
MTLKTHFETGIGLSLLIGGMAIQKIDVMDISAGSKLGIMAAILVGVTAGSVYPDIDLEESNLNADDMMMRWESKLDHRGIVHTLINVAGIVLPFALLNLLLKTVTPFDVTWITVLGLSMSVGCVWHMLLDSMTPNGISWLYPLTRFRFKIPIIRNHFTERIFRIIVTSIFLYYAIHFWSTNF